MYYIVRVNPADSENPPQTGVLSHTGAGALPQTGAGAQTETGAGALPQTGAGAGSLPQTETGAGALPQIETGAGAGAGAFPQTGAGAPHGLNPTLIGEPSRKCKIYLYGPYSVTEGFEESTSSKRARTGTRLYLWNLAYSTSEQDIMGLFSRVKSAEHCSIYYDCLGRSLGAGEVIFSNLSDAKAVMKEFDSVNLYLEERELNLEIGMKYSDLPRNLTEIGAPPRTGAPLQTAATGVPPPPQTAAPPSRDKLYLDFKNQLGLQDSEQGQGFTCQTWPIALPRRMSWDSFQGCLLSL